MHCIRPIKAGFNATGDIVYSSKKISKELASFAFPCRKCIPCRLNMAREKAIRAYHESQMWDDNIFLTLTYDDEHLKSDRLQWIDFDLFIKRLNEKLNRGLSKENRRPLPYMVTGEYGDKTKRPHWHVLIFNFRPDDAKKHYVTELGEQVYTSEFIRDLWTHGNIEFGSVTLDSASYVARYAAKKLAHGNDQDHDYHPIHNTSKKHAIGKKWIEKYHEQTFSRGYVVLPNGSQGPIPRYYQDWYKKNHPEKWMEYDAKVKLKSKELAEMQSRKDQLDDFANFINYKGGTNYPLSRTQVKLAILKSKFKQLQEKLKL